MHSIQVVTDVSITLVGFARSRSVFGMIVCATYLLIGMSGGFATANAANNNSKLAGAGATIVGGQSN